MILWINFCYWKLLRIGDVWLIILVYIFKKKNKVRFFNFRNKNDFNNIND